VSDVDLSLAVKLYKPRFTSVEGCLCALPCSVSDISRGQEQDSERNFAFDCAGWMVFFGLNA